MCNSLRNLWEVAERFDAWRQELTYQQEGSDFNEESQRALAHFLKVTTHLRPWLIRCYEVEGLPRTDKALEDTIRAIKQRYRRISGRKSWNRYLLRYGRYVAFFEGLARSGAERHQAEWMLRGVGRTAWQAGRSALQQSRREQRNKYRFRRQREQYLCSLEHRWAQTTARSSELS